MSFASHLKEAGFMAAGRVLRSAVSARALDSATRRRPLFQILVYHRVLPAEDPFAMSPVSSEAFDRQMALLRARFRPVSLDRLVVELDAGTVAPGTVCVTFDDGYRDNHDHAWPILKKHGIPAAIFLATGLIGTGAASWYDQVLALLRDAKASTLDWEPAGLRAAALSGKGARAAAAHRLLEWLKGFPPAERDAHIRDIARRLGGAADAADKAMLDWDQVKRMHADGVIFGAHTVNHPILSRIGKAEMDAEIGTSKRAIEEKLQAPVRHFAYPNGRSGDYNADTLDVVKTLGFATAVTTNPGVNDSGTDRHQWMRRQPWENSVDSLYFRMLAERLGA